MTKLYAKSHDDIARVFVSEPDDETIEVPRELIRIHQTGRLRLMAGQVVDIAALKGPFFVSPDDSRLTLHVVATDGMSRISCAWDDHLVVVDGAVKVSKATA